MDKENLGDFLKEARGDRSIAEICEAVKAIFPDDVNKQISTAYLNRVENKLARDVHPKKLSALAYVLNVDYFKLLYLADYLDSYEGLKNEKDNKVLDKRLGKIINLDKIFADTSVSLHFSGNLIPEEKRKAILTVVKSIIKNNK